MLVYSAYKKYQKNKLARSDDGYTRKLSTDSDTTPLGIDMGGRKGLAREGTFSEVVDKKAARKQWISLGISLFIDVVLPLVLYYIIKNYTSILVALLISSTPPAISVIVKIIYYRKVDPLGIIIVFGFALSAIISVVDGDPRVLLLRESIVTAATGGLFLITLIPLKVGKIELRPLTYGITAQMTAAAPAVRYLRYGEWIEVSRSEFSWQYSKKFRFGMRLGTFLWGICLLLEFTAKLIMYFSPITIDQFVLYGNVVLGVVMGGMGIFTMFHAGWLKKQVEKEMIDIKAQLARDAAEFEAEHTPYQPDQGAYDPQAAYDPQPPFDSHGAYDHQGLPHTA